MTADQRVFPVEEVLAASRTDDLAILRISARGLRPLPIGGNPAAAPVGAPVAVISHPDGRFYCYTSGIVSRYMKIRSADQQADGHGIGHLDRERRSFRCYGQADGLINDVVTDIALDHKGRLCATMQGGVARFEADRGQFVQFTAEDGLPSVLAKTRAASRRGHLWVTRHGISAQKQLAEARARREHP